MGAQLDRMMDVIEKEDKILERLITLTENEKVTWTRMNLGISYVGRLETVTIEFRPMEQLLTIDGHSIQSSTFGESRSPKFFERLDSAIQYQLLPRGTRYDMNSHLRGILEILSKA